MVLPFVNLADSDQDYLVDGVTISKYVSQALIHNPLYLTQRRQFCDGLRRFGVPEH